MEMEMRTEEGGEKQQADGAAGQSREEGERLRAGLSLLAAMQVGGGGSMCVRVCAHVCERA